MSAAEVRKSCPICANFMHAAGLEQATIKELPRHAGCGCLQ